MEIDDKKQLIKSADEEFRRLKVLIRKYRDGWKRKAGIVKLGEPVVQLMRRNQRIEYYECPKNASKFVFKHSDGDNVTVPLLDSYIHTADYAGDTMKMYVLHEDWAFPMPPKPLVEAKEFKNAVDNAMSAEMKWKAEERKANAKMIWAFVGMVGIVGGIFLLYILLKPQEPAPIIQIMQNVSPTM